MAIKLFVDGNSTATVSDNDTTVIGASTGTQNIKIASGVTGVATDANIERVDVAGNLADYKFVAVPGVGTQIQNAAGTVVGTIPSINAAGGLTVAFADGSAPLVQTGASSYTLGGTAIPTTAAAITSTTLGTNFNTAVKSAVTGSTTTPSAFTLTTSAGTLTEAASGTSNMTFTVTLSAAQSTATTVNYATSSGTAANSATVTADYTTTNGTLTIPANSTSATFTVPVVGDGVFDGTVANPTGTEVFTVTLSSPSAGTLVNTTTTGTITDLQTNALPTQTLPTTNPNVLLGSQGTIPGVVIADANNNNVTVVLTAQNGLMDTSAASGAIAQVTSSTRTLTLNGSITDINGALALLRYTSDRTIAGSDTISIVTTDPLGGVSTTGTLNVTVNPGGVFTSATNTFAGTSGNDFYLADETNNINAADTLAASTGTGDTLTMTVFDGTMANTAAFTGLENIVLTTTTGAARTVSIDVAAKLDTNVNSISITDGDTTANDTTVTLSNVNSGTTVTLNKTLATSADIGMVNTTGTLTLALAGGVTVPSLLAATNPAATLNIQSNGSTANVITSLTTGILATTGIVNISGAAPLTFTLGAQAVPTINGGSATGALTITASANTLGSAATITGGNANDTITGDSDQANSLVGGSGNDTITGGTGADTINGGAGDDSLVGGTGADSMTGGTGKDTYTVDTSGDKIVLVTGDTGTVAAGTADVINGIVAGTIVNVSGYLPAGTTWAATFLANGNLATATAGASSTLRDIYIDSAKKAIVIEMDATGTTTQEIYIGTASQAAISNTDGALTFGAVPMVSYISGTTVLVEGQDPSAGTVTANLSTAYPQIQGNNVAGAATSYANLDMSKLIGNTGSTITGSALANNIIGSAAADTITAGAGNDTIASGAGSDVIVINAVVGTSTDSAGTAGTASAYGTVGDTITDFAFGTDHLQVTASGVTTFVHGTQSVLSSGTTLAAGTGAANFAFGGATAAVGLFSFNGGTDFTEAGDVAVGFTGATGGNATQGTFETTFLGALKYNLTGSASGDTITTGALNDTIRGGAGGDTINIGTGTDYLIVASNETASVASTNVTTPGTLGATEAFTWTGTPDIITGFGAGDTIQLYTSGTTGITTSGIVVAAGGVIPAATVGGFAVIRGTQTNATTFTAAVAGADAAVIWDADGTGAGTTYNGIILVGYAGNVTNDTISTSGLFTAVA